MFLKFKISCTCGCCYSSNENISVTKIICPNCGLEHPYSDKLLEMLKTAKEIPDGKPFDDVRTSVISFEEDMKNHQ